MKTIPSSLLTGLWLLFFSCPLPAQAPKILFEKYGVADGLPEETVIAPMQDDQGFVWFITQNGLVKYDGYDFKVFRDDGKAGTGPTYL